MPCFLVLAALIALLPMPPQELSWSSQISAGAQPHGASPITWLEGGVAAAEGSARKRGRSNRARAKGPPTLVILLPGGTYGRARPEERSQWVLEQAEGPARRLGLRVLVPVPQEGSGPSVPFLDAWGEAAILARVEEELAEGRAVADRVTLAGYGVGATAALGLAARHRGTFAAAAIWSGTPAPLWERGRDGRPLVVDLAEDPVPGLRGTPVYLSTGRDDPLLDRDCLALFVERMRLASARSRAWRLMWDEGPGGHDMGHGGPEAGLRFLAGHRQRERP